MFEKEIELDSTSLKPGHKVEKKYEAWLTDDDAQGFSVSDMSVNNFSKL